MSAMRTALAAVSLVLGLGFAAAGLWRLPAFGHYPGPYGDILNAVGTNERHGTNIVTLVNFDYRGFDTLGEEYMLFAAAIGAVVLLREHRGEETTARPGKISERPVPGAPTPSPSAAVSPSASPSFLASTSCCTRSSLPAAGFRAVRSSARRCRCCISVSATASGAD